MQIRREPSFEDHNREILTRMAANRQKLRYQIEELKERIERADSEAKKAAYRKQIEKMQSFVRVLEKFEQAYGSIQ